MSAADALYELTLGTQNLVLNSLLTNNLAFTNVDVDDFEVNVSTTLFNKTSFRYSEVVGAANIITSQLPIEMYDQDGDQTYVIPTAAGQPGQTLAMPQTGTTLVWQDGGSSSGVSSIGASSNFVLTGSQAPNQTVTGDVGIDLSANVDVLNLSISGVPIPKATGDFNGQYLGCNNGVYAWGNPSQGGSTVVAAGTGTNVTNVGDIYTVSVEDPLALGTISADTVNIRGLEFPIPTQAGTVLGYDGTVMDWVPEGQGGSLVEGVNIAISTVGNATTIATNENCGFVNVTLETLTIGQDPFPIPGTGDNGKVLGVSAGVYQLQPPSDINITAGTNIIVGGTVQAPVISTDEAVTFTSCTLGQASAVSLRLTGANQTIINFPETSSSNLTAGNSMVISSVVGDVVTLDFADVSGGGGGGISEITSTESQGQLGISLTGNTVNLQVLPNLFVDSINLGGAQLPLPSTPENGNVIGCSAGTYAWVPNANGVQSVTGDSNVNSTGGDNPVISLNPSGITLDSGTVSAATIQLFDGVNKYAFPDPESTYAVASVNPGYVLGIVSHTPPPDGQGSPYLTTLGWLDPQAGALPPFTAANDGQVLTVVNDTLEWVAPVITANDFDAGQVTATTVGSKVALNLSENFYGYATGIISWQGQNGSITAPTVTKDNVMQCQCTVQRVFNTVTVYCFIVDPFDLTGASTNTTEWITTYPTGQPNSFQDLLIAAGVPAVSGPVFGQILQAQRTTGGIATFNIAISFNSASMFAQLYNQSTPFAPAIPFDSEQFIVGFNQTYMLGVSTDSTSDFTISFTIPPV